MKRIKRILLIDDDVITNFLHKRLIDDLDVTEEMVVMTRADEALQFIRGKSQGNQSAQGGNEVILLDLNMPGMDGFEFLEEFCSLELEKKPKVVVVSSSEDPRDLKRVQGLGAEAFIPKPLTEEKVLNIVELIG